MTLGEFLQEIFSITDYGETHHLLRFCGLKIKFPKKEYADKRKENPYYYYKKNNIDITTIPPATGQIRDIQLANLELLKELDFVCKQNNLEYWLDYGTMLGAVRHKGYIPWDDDIDVGMIRTDYNRIVDVFNSKSRNSDLYAEYYADKNKNLIIKIRHKHCSHINIDIFPYDFCSEKIIGNDALKTTSKIKKICRKLQKQQKNSTIEELLNTYKILRETLTTEDSKEYLVRGVEFCGFPKNWFYKYETIFPLKTICFENVEFPCLNNTEEFLRSLYGNYNDYPKRIGVGHTGLLELNDKEKEIIKELITEKECV